MDKFRLITLSTTCFISFLIFWITFVVTVVWDHCWSFEQFWFETLLPATPYNWFLLLFIIIALWWLSETALVVINKSFNFFNVSTLSIVLIFLLVLSIVFYNFNIYYNITKGISDKKSLILIHYEEPTEQEEYTIKLINKDGDIVQKPSFDYDHWLNLRDARTCDLGVDFNSYDKKQWRKLKNQYELFIGSEYEKIGLDYDVPAKYSRKYEAQVQSN